MLAYYPLEHLSYLLFHGLIPSKVPSILSLFSSSDRQISLDANGLSIWSCRFWALYVFLQFAHLREDFVLLRARQRNLRKGKGTGLSSIEKKELQQRWDAYWSDFVTNLGYLPLTVHWWEYLDVKGVIHYSFRRIRSLEKGLFKNDVSTVDFFLIIG